MNLSRRVSVNTLAQLGGRLFNSTITFVITALILPVQLGEQGFGVFAFYLTLYQLFATMLGFGADTIVIREASRDRASAGRLIGMLIMLKARFAAVAVLLLVAVAVWFETLGARAALLTLAAMHLLFHAPSGAGAIFHVDMAFGRSALAAALGQAAWMIVTLGMLVAGVTEPAMYLIAFGAWAAVNGALNYHWARALVTVDFGSDRAQRRELWRDAWPVGVSISMAATYFYIDTIMLRPLLGEVAVAHYSAAYRLMGFVLMVPVLFSQVLFPVMTRLWAVGTDALAPFFQRTTRFLVSLSLVFPACVWMVRRDVMVLIYPEPFAQGALSLGILSLAVVPIFAAYPHIHLLLAAGHQRLMMRISAYGAAFNIVLNLLVIPRYGIEGAAVTTVATELYIVLAAAISTRRKLGLSFSLPLALRPLACAGATALALHFVLGSIDPDAVGLRVLIGVGMGVFGVLACGVLPLDLGGEEGAPAS
jgi:O-antigen/teichoic acid export membrane protein